MTPKQAKYFRTKGNMSVIDAIRVAYEEVPQKFYGTWIIAKVKRLTGRPTMHDDSAKRKMNLLRAKQEINYICLSVIDSYYQKL